MLFDHLLNAALALHLPSALLVILWIGVLRAARYSGWKVAALSFVGTVGHELCHLVAGILLGAKPTSISLIPRREGNTWVLGSVGFRRLTLWNAGPVAFAPLLLLVAGWVLMARAMPWLLEQDLFLLWGITGYLSACALFSGWPSSADVRIGAASAFIYFVTGWGLYQAISIA